MKVTASTATSKYQVYDAQGTRIPYVVSYDTVTKEIEVMLFGEKQGSLPKVLMSWVKGNQFQPVIVKGVIEGSYLEIDGVRYVGE